MSTPPYGELLSGSWVIWPRAVRRFACPALLQKASRLARKLLPFGTKAGTVSAESGDLACNHSHGASAFLGLKHCDQIRHLRHDASAGHPSFNPRVRGPVLMLLRQRQPRSAIS